MPLFYTIKIIDIVDYFKLINIWFWIINMLVFYVISFLISYIFWFFFKIDIRIIKPIWITNMILNIVTVPYQIITANWNYGGLFY